MAGHEPIAIIGIGCRLPGKVRSTEDFWSVVHHQRRDTATDVPPERWSMENLYDPGRTKQGGIVCPKGAFIDGIDEFDNAFFMISPREAASMDPQQRHLLEVVMEAFEDAGCQPGDSEEMTTGVYVGIGMPDYRVQTMEGSLINAYTLTGSSHSLAANRVSYAFNLSGPSYAVDSACASSITSLHLACSGLARGECQVAVVAGCNSITIPEMSMGFSALGVMSPSGKCCPFSNSADGYVRGEGWGVLILKSLQDAIRDDDHVYALVRGSAIAANGSGRSLTMPSREAQERVMRKAYACCDVAMDDIYYVEAHGTGTPVGDPIEAEAIGSVFSSHRNKPIKIGSAKGNFGHSEYASGVTSSIKVALMLQKKQLCPTVNYTGPNTDIDMERLNIQVQTESENIDSDGQVLMGLNSFGFGGAVAHAIFEEAPKRQMSSSDDVGICNWKFGKDDSGDAIIIPLSAKTRESLLSNAGTWMKFQSDLDAQKIVSWVASRRKHHECRLATVCSSGREFSEMLSRFVRNESAEDGTVVTGRTRSNPPKICMVFPGQGQQWDGMGRALYATEETFRNTVNHCDAIFEQLSGWSVLERTGLFIDDQSQAVCNSTVDINDTVISQPAILFFQLGLFKLWQHWGISPDAVVGHSLGEIAAACACGGLTTDEAVKVIYHRSTQQSKLRGEGGMIAVRLSLLAAKELCSSQDDLHIAAINSPTAITIAGNNDSIENISSITNGGKSIAKRLRVQSAYHTPTMSPAEEPFKTAMGGVIKTRYSLQQTTKMYSTVTGQLYTEDFDTEYWWHNIRDTVEFQAAIQTILEDENPDIFLECGASATLLSSIKEMITKTETDRDFDVMIIPCGIRKKDARLTVLSALSTLYTVGVDVNWRSVTKDCAEWAPGLPTYSWQHQSHWLESLSRRNMRLGNDDRTFYSQNGRISWECFPYLKDHVLEGKPVFPGAGHVEYAIEAAVPYTELPCLKNISFTKILLWPSTNELCLDFFRNSSNISISSGGVVYSSAEISATNHISSRGLSPSLDRILSRCSNSLSSRAFYDLLATVGFQYGTMFQVVEEAAMGDGEMVGFLRPTPNTKQRIQVTHLDGCFQLLIAAVGSGLSLYLPVAIESINMHVPSLPVGQSFIAHAVVTDYDTLSLTGDIHLATASGKALVDIKGCVFSNMKRKGSENIVLSSFLYTTKYQDVCSRLPSTEMVRDVFDSCLDNASAATKAEQALPLIKAVCASYIRNALNTAADGDINRCGQRYIERLRQIANNTDVQQIPYDDIPINILNLTRNHPELNTELRLIEEYGSLLPETLHDKARSNSMLFSQEGLPSYFADALTMRFFYDAGSSALTKAIRAAAHTRHVIRVLEIGVRGGELTKEILRPLMDLGVQGRLEYTCSYTAQSIFPQPWQTLQDEFPFVKYQSYDIELDPGKQGLVRDSVDIVICLDVLHAAVDRNNTLHQLRSLLCVGGWLFAFEITNSHYIAELVFGTLDGCWVYEDADSDTCWLSQSAWKKTMNQQGYHDVEIVSTTCELLHSIIVGRKTDDEHNNGNPSKTLRPIAKQHWYMIVENEMPLNNNTVKNLIRKEHLYCPSKINEIASKTKQHCTTNDTIHIVYPWDQSDINGKTLACFLQNLASLGENSRHTRVYVVTVGEAVDAAVAIGLVRAVNNQIIVPTYSIHLSDQSQGSVEALSKLLEENTKTPDREITIESGFVKVPRVMRIEIRDEDTIKGSSTDLWQLVTNREPGKRSTLDDLAFVPLPDMEPGVGEVVVRIRATSLNFKDVMQALGLLDGLEDDKDGGVHLGLECSGVVVKIGTDVTNLLVNDEVYGFGKHCLASHTLCNAMLLVPKPSGLGWTDCAGAAVVFGTAYYSLIERANLCSEDTLLIHSACGGVGLAAIQIARLAGSRIICSAGTEHKRTFLREVMKIDMVTDSRSEGFYEDVMVWTDGNGADVILNSLHGKLLMKGVEALAPGGRFCEIGKRDLLKNSNFQMNLLLENKSFLSCQIDRLMKLRPRKARDVLLKVASFIENGTYQPVLTQVTSIENSLAAFVTAAKGAHMGKVVFDIPKYFKPSKLMTSYRLFKASATYIITGGHGRLGLVFARWLCDKGARYIALVSRGGCRAAASKRTMNYLRRNNAQVYNFALDITDEAKVKRMFRELREEHGAPPCRGIFHLAGVITDESLIDLTPELIDQILGAKATGARHFHHVSLGEPLDYFFMMSSSITLWANPSQPCYVAANACLDALAEARRAEGLPALSLQVGPITGAGYMDDNLSSLKALEMKGQLSIDVIEVLRCVGLLLQMNDLPAVVCLTNQDWDLTMMFCHKNSMKFRHLTTDGPNSPAAAAHHSRRCRRRRVTVTNAHAPESLLRRKMADLLYMDTNEVAIDVPMVNYGVDSMMAVEIVSWASNEIGASVSQIEILSGITAKDILERAIAQPS